MEFQTIAKKSTNLCLALGENHITEKQTLAFCQLKATNWSAESFKKALNLSELAPEPVIRSCDSGQRIPFFDSCQLTIIWMSVIKLNTGQRHFTLVFLWRGRSDVRLRDDQNFLAGQITKFSQVWVSAHACVELRRKDHWFLY